MELYDTEESKIKYYSSSEKKSEIISLRISKEMLEKISTISLKKEWSRNHVIYKAVEDYVDKELRVKVE